MVQLSLRGHVVTPKCSCVQCVHACNNKNSTRKGKQIACSSVQFVVKSSSASVLIKMPSLTQIVPYEIDQDRRTAKIRYDKDYAEHISLLQESYNGLLLKIFPPEIHSPYPVSICVLSY